MSEHASRSVRRAPVLAVIIAALVAGGLIDGITKPGPPATQTTSIVQPMPVAAPAAALSSSWFCAGANSGGSVPIPGQVVIANDGPRAVKAVVTVLGSSSQPRTVPVSVAPFSSSTVDESVHGALQWVGAIVSVDGGSVGVDQVGDGPLGRSVTPCATSGSQHWYFPAGQTRVNADEAILLLNPYRTDSIVDLSFSTDQGIEVPQNLQGIDVPAHGLVGVDIRSQLRRRSSIAVTASARTGSVVAWQTSWVTPPPSGSPLVGTAAAKAPLADPALPVAGTEVMLGAPSAGRSWAWPDGLAGNGIGEQYVVYNPGPRTAKVRLSIGLQQGSAEPLSVDVGPYQAIPIVSEQQARIPAGVPHTATLTSVNGVPVVAARTITASAAPAPGGPRNGLGELLGSRLTARDWLLPAAMTDAAHQGHVVIANPGVTAVQVSVAGLGASKSTQKAVPAGGRVDVTLPAGVSGALDVRSSGAVTVEYDLYGTQGGISLSLGIPLS